jgi:putative aldouronate transport system permease protein
VKRSRGEQLFEVFNYTFLSIFCFATLYPFLYVLSASLSSHHAIATGEVILFPVDFNTNAYKLVFGVKGLWISYANTIYYTVVGTLYSLFLTVCGAYVLSKKRLHGRTFITFFIVFTMWFGGGLIPTYLNLSELGLLDKRITIVIAFSTIPFYFILLRTYFQAIPEEMEQSAKMDGASDITILTKIILPLSIPALAVISLYYAVNRWNGFFWSMLVLSDKNKIPLQVFLRQMLILMDVGEAFSGTAYDSDVVAHEMVIYATIVVSVVPIICVYPFIQKYFVKGIMIGSLKG